MTRKTYQENERYKAAQLIKDKNPVFYGGLAGKMFMRSKRDFVLLESSKNFFNQIREDVLNYFNKNQISWWGGNKPTGHVLSSQIACLNHLFRFREDKKYVLNILSKISPNFIDVLKITTDKFDSAYLQFESVSDYDYLNEGVLKRGNNCTSIDALIYAVHSDKSKWLIPIEWKYTEHYNNQNKAIEGFKQDPVNCKGEIRKKRYTELITNSKQLKNYNHYCYYFEPFYQLMRQTLWAEQMIKNKVKERIKAENYLHVHVIPQRNIELLEKNYKCSGKNMETTWREHLLDQSKYKIISPEELLSGIKDKTHEELIHYLTVRYWNN